ncbi:MAG: SDR family oxidoreductase, partial [Chloroflexi bacterium]|nr:SDR family oxidoreductase [Chloroflexota bacterium]
MADVAWGLTDRVILVVGATGGIGRAICAALAADGARVAASSTTLAKAAALVATLGDHARPFQCDVTEPASVDALIDAVVAQFGTIDGVVNTAGINIRRPALEVSEADWLRVMTINLVGAFRVARGAARVMADRGRGRVVTISSIRGKIGFRGGYSAYNASKAGIDMMTRQLAVEWAPHAITVNAVAPGFVETPLIQPLLDNPEMRHRITERVPLGRL